MVIALCHIELHLPASGSLKEKRKVIASLRDRLRRRYNISFAEVEHQDLWQRSVLALVAVSSDRGSLERMFQSAKEEIYRSVPGEVLGFDLEYL